MPPKFSSSSFDTPSLFDNVAQKFEQGNIEEVEKLYNSLGRDEFLLLIQKKDPTEGRFNYTLLHYAAKADSGVVLNFVAENFGDDVLQVTNENKTNLAHVATSVGALDNMRLLYQKFGVKIFSQKDTWGNNACVFLTKTPEIRLEAAIRFLLEINCDFLDAPHSGKSALDLLKDQCQGFKEKITEGVRIFERNKKFSKGGNRNQNISHQRWYDETMPDMKKKLERMLGVINEIEEKYKGIPPLIPIEEGSTSDPDPDPDPEISISGFAATLVSSGGCVKQR